MQIAFQLLGGFHVGDVRLTEGLNSRHQALIAYLALLYPKPVQRSEVAFKLWPDSNEEQALTNLRKALHQIKQIFSNSDLIQVDSRMLQLQLSQDDQLDVVDFTSALDAAERARSANNVDAELSALETVSVVYRGDLLPNLYDEWLIPERDRLRDMFIRAMDRLIVLLEARKHYRDASKHAQRLLQTDNLREETYRQLMRLQLQLGDRASALRTYQICVNVLETSLGVEPDMETRKLYDRALKDQIQTYKNRITNIPEVLTSFIGRSEQVTKINNFLPNERLITLTGPGGCGKTRLAIQSSIEAMNLFPDGVWWVDLSSLMDEKLILQQFISALGIQESPHQPLQETLITFLMDRVLLIVVDNCEHLIQATAEVIFNLLSRCHSVRILATSREKLLINGEIVFQVPPLPERESIELFTERAQFALKERAIDENKLIYIRQICHRLDGIPLAIELAAARVDVFDVQLIAERLDDRFNLLTDGQRAAFPRHKTLRATIDWSYNLLSEKEREFFCRLSVFMGGWTLEAAEEVCIGGGVARSDIANLLSRLVDKSLISISSAPDGSNRYYLLDTVRHYVLEIFKTRKIAKKFQAKHLEYFVMLAERADPELVKAQQEYWLKQLDLEQANFRLAMDWALNDSQIEKLGRLITALGLYWHSYGKFTEAREWVGQLINRDDLSLHIKSYACFWIGLFVGMQGKLDESANFFLEALKLSQLTGYRKSASRGHFGLGATLLLQGKFPEASKHLDESMNVTRELGDITFMPYILVVQGDGLVASGSLVEARSKYEECLKISRETGDARSMSQALGALGELACLSQDYTQARILFEQSLALLSEGRDLWNFTWRMNRLGNMAMAQGDVKRAREFLGESLSLARKMGDRNGIARALMGFVSVLYAEGRDEKSVQLQGFVTGLYEQIGTRPGYVEQVENTKTVEIIKAQMGDRPYQRLFDLGKLITLDVALSLMEVQTQ